MKFFALGGSHEVGASSYLLTTAGVNILVDAGIRMGGREEDRLPDLSAIDKAGGLHGVLVTHAHMDHIGALPLVHSAYPDTPIFCTPPTRALMQVLLLDSLKIMADRWNKEQEIPLYPPEAVIKMLKAAREVPFGERVSLEQGVSFEFYPAGHILGASMALLHSSEGTVLFSGDLSLTPQRTVECALVPKRRPHVFICESTYGQRLHANRRDEERRLLHSVSEVIGRGGKVLIPAFALGRAQEVLLVLKEALRQNDIPRCNVYADGMVKNICAHYNTFHEYLARDLQKGARRGIPLFFEQDRGILEVTHPDERQKITEGPPCIIVSSSGMLSGGPSVFYAGALSGDEKNAIFLTGYQDEESPGRALQGMTDENRTVQLGGSATVMQCQVGTYSLSAHADSGELAALVSRLAPAHVILVHGDEEARVALSRKIEGKSRIHLPVNGEEVSIFVRALASGSLPSGTSPLGAGRPIDRIALEAMRTHLLGLSRDDRLYTLQELTALWSGRGDNPEERELLKECIAREPGILLRDPRRPFFYRPAPEGGRMAPLEINTALAAVTRLFAHCPDIYRSGAQQDDHCLVLYFKFPLTAAKLYRKELAELEQATGWSVKINESTHLGALQEKTVSLFPAGTLTRTPSLYPAERIVKVKMQAGAVTKDDGAAIADELALVTGFTLIIEEVDSPLPALAQDVLSDSAMEINRAFHLIKDALKGVTIHRLSRKQDNEGRPFIEAAFISPLVGERCRKQLQELENHTGWTIRICTEPNQHAIKERARSMLPQGWAVRKEPGFFGKEGYVRVKVPVLPPADDIAELSERLKAETGFELRVVLD